MDRNVAAHVAYPFLTEGEPKTIDDLEHPFVLANKFCTVGRFICRPSAWNFLHVNLMASIPLCLVNYKIHTVPSTSLLNCHVASKHRYCRTLNSESKEELKTNVIIMKQLVENKCNLAVHLSQFSSSTHARIKCTTHRKNNYQEKWTTNYLNQDTLS